MNRPLFIGLTGGIGSGKSLALAELRRAGAEVIDLDEIARRQAKSPALAARLKRAFGTSERAAIAAQVFRHPAKRRKLEGLTHPPILREMRRRMRAAKGVVVVDVPLLFEGGLQGEFDATVTISASRSVRLKRLAARGLPRAQALARMRAQLSDARRERKADVVWRNDGSAADFKASVARYGRGLRLMQESPQ